MIRNIAINKGIRRDQNVIPDTHVSDDGRVASDPYAISDRRYAFSYSPIFLTDRNAFMNIAVFPDLRFCVDRNIINMSEI